jgi:hypothetical protein
MFRVLLFALGAAIAACVALYFLTSRARYLAWARGLFVTGLAAGVLFFAVLIVKRLI